MTLRRTFTTLIFASSVTIGTSSLLANPAIHGDDTGVKTTTDSTHLVAQRQQRQQRQQHQQHQQRQQRQHGRRVQRAKQRNHQGRRGQTSGRNSKRGTRNRPSLKKNRNRYKGANKNTVKALARTHVALKMARLGVKKNDKGKTSFAKAAVAQRAAGFALKKGQEPLALFLTRMARQHARAAIKANRGRVSKRIEDQPSEFDRADGRGAKKLLDIAKKLSRRGKGHAKKSKRMFAKTALLLKTAARAAKKNGSGEGELREAAVHLRAARVAAKEGEKDKAKALLKKARQIARQILKANRTAEPAATQDEPGEFSGISATASVDSEYIAVADAEVSSSVDESTVDEWDEVEEATTEETPDFADFDYELEDSE